MKYEFIFEPNGTELQPDEAILELTAEGVVPEEYVEPIKPVKSADSKRADYAERAEQAAVSGGA